MVWELVVLERPHKDVVEHHQKKKIGGGVAGLIDFVVHQQGRPSLERIPPIPGLREMLDACWHPDPSKRPTSKNLVKGLMEVLADNSTTRREEEEESKGTRSRDRIRQDAAIDLAISVTTADEDKTRPKVEIELQRPEDTTGKGQHINENRPATSAATNKCKRTWAPHMFWKHRTKSLSGVTDTNHSMEYESSEVL
jgi:hypothetical protein